MVLDFLHVEASSEIFVFELSFGFLGHYGLILGFEGFLVKAFEEISDTDKGLEFFHGAEYFFEFLTRRDSLDLESFLHVVIILIELVSLMNGFFGGGFILKREFNILIKLFHDGSNIDILLAHGMFIMFLLIIFLFGI
jgi:hypothetical protein